MPIKYTNLILDEPGTESLGAWFLGPRAENQQEFLDLIKQAIEHHGDDRKAYFPSDTSEWITEEVKQTDIYKQSMQILSQAFETLLDELDGSVPFYSPRYQGHMNWDVTIPALLGYFAAMLNNPNNVASEASPVTTVLEMRVANDLCRMLGYPNSPSEVLAEDQTQQADNSTKPWGHLTCDGTVANIEAMWASRNLKYYPVSVAAAINNDARLLKSRNVLINLPTGDTHALADLGTWQLLNLTADDILSLPDKIKDTSQLSTQAFEEILRPYTLQELGFQEFARKFLCGINEAAILGPGNMHYSWPKGAALLGMGRSNLVPVPLDSDARMDLHELEVHLDRCFGNLQPVVMVVAVVGSTAEGAVDRLHEIVELREAYRKKGLDFCIHADAAWGGYFASMLRSPSQKVDERDRDARALSAEELADSLGFTEVAVETRSDSRKFRSVYPARLALTAQTEKSFKALPHADSITVDPHKAGYIPYAAGALCYRNKLMRELVSFKAPVVFHDPNDPTLGVYGIEGSTAGAAAAATYLSHRVIRTDRTGYGRLLGRCIFNSKRLYAALVTMEQTGDRFIIRTLREPAAMLQDREGELQKINDLIIDRSNKDIFGNHAALEMLKELGSDLLIIAYAFNFYRKDGTPNTDLDLLNQLNQEIYRRLSLSTVSNTAPPLFLAESELAPRVHGMSLTGSFKKRLLRVDDFSDRPVRYLVSTTMNPWLTDTISGNFIPKIIESLRDTVDAVIEEISPSR